MVIDFISILYLLNVFFDASRRRSSSGDSMEHALARTSSPRPSRERPRRGSVSSSSSHSSSSSSASHSDKEGESKNFSRSARSPARSSRPSQRPSQRANQRPPSPGPATERSRPSQSVTLTSGRIKYSGHKDIKLILNKVSRIEFLIL